MTRASIVARLAIAGGLLAGCFSGNDSTNHPDAGPFGTDSSVTLDAGGHADTGPPLDSTVAESGADAAAEAGPEAAPETGTEAGIDATAEAGIDAAPEAGPEAGPDAFACTAATECPAGTACNTTTGQCGLPCGDAQHTACNGGCCSPASGQCVAGTAGTACGSTGAACTSCTGNAAGTACVSGNSTCGCNFASDCPANQACNTTTHTCGTACGSATSSACNGGCCDPLAAQCVAGTANGACGNTGAACIGCANGTPTCAGGACTSACGQSADGTCSGGTCCTTAGTCKQEGTGTSCSISCLDCTGQPAGSACILNTRCGCNVAADCPAYHTCDTTKNTCTTVCGQTGLTLCNGGCCPPATAAAPTCATGLANNDCGLTGGTCANCTVSKLTCNANGLCQ